MDPNSFISFNGVDSDDGGDFSVADTCGNALNSEDSLESDSAPGQDLAENPVKLRRDGACYTRHSEFVLPGDKPAQREQVRPAVQHRITNMRNAAPEWSKKCSNPYTYGLCCIGAMRRIEKRHVQSKIKVEQCIWSKFCSSFPHYF